MDVVIPLMGTFTSLLIISQIMVAYLDENWMTIVLVEVDVFLSTQGKRIQQILHYGKWVSESHIKLFALLYIYILLSLIHYLFVLGCKTRWAQMGEQMGSWQARLAHWMQCNECLLSRPFFRYPWWGKRFGISSSWEWTCTEPRCLLRKQCELLDAQWFC